MFPNYSDEPVCLRACTTSNEQGRNSLERKNNELSFGKLLKLSECVFWSQDPMQMQMAINTGVDFHAILRALIHLLEKDEVKENKLWLANFMLFHVDWRILRRWDREKKFGGARMFFDGKDCWQQTEYVLFTACHTIYSVHPSVWAYVVPTGCEGGRFKKHSTFPSPRLPTFYR